MGGGCSAGARPRVQPLEETSFNSVVADTPVFVARVPETRRQSKASSRKSPWSWVLRNRRRVEPQREASKPLGTTRREVMDARRQISTGPFGLGRQRSSLDQPPLVFSADERLLGVKSGALDQMPQYSSIRSTGMTSSDRGSNHQLRRYPSMMSSTSARSFAVARITLTQGGLSNARLPAISHGGQFNSSTTSMLSFSNRGGRARSFGVPARVSVSGVRSGSSRLQRNIGSASSTTTTTSSRSGGRNQLKTFENAMQHIGDIVYSEEDKDFIARPKDYVSSDAK